MGRIPDRQERLAALLVVLGAAVVFGPVVWLLEQWREALARDPASARGAEWLGERLSAHPYLTAGALLLGAALAGGLAVLILFAVARRLAARLAGRSGSGQRSARR
jgi:hypothetical protein